MSERNRQNALNEIRILASEDSEHIVGYKEAFYDEESKTLNIIMEYAAGGDVSKMIKKNNKAGKQCPES